MNSIPASAPPERILYNGKIVTLDATSTVATAAAIAGDHFAAVGGDAEVRCLAGPETEGVDLGGACMIPGLIDGHAHMDREGLKRRLPSLAEARSIDDILVIIRKLAAASRPGEWIVTMPVGTPPAYEDAPGCLTEGRFPNRHDLDRASPDNPVYIRSIWGYWRPALPLVSIANSAALKAAGIDRHTKAPVDTVEIESDPKTGEITGIFREWNKMPVVELTLMSAAPHFDLATRNAVGTTGVFEGHGAAADVVAAYQRLHRAGRQTVRAALVFSPAWGSTGPADIHGMVHSWARWLAGKGLGDDWLSLQGIYTEVDDSPETALRGAASPQPGWAGFHYDSAIPKKYVLELLAEAARAGLQIVGIFPYMLDLYRDIARKHPIGDLRWVLGHLSTLTAEEIAEMADLGIGATTHNSAHIYKRAHEHMERLGAERHSEIVPLRSLIEAGVPISFGSDNAPLNLFRSIWHAVARTNRQGDVVAPDQALSPEEALRCATAGGAWLSFDEDRRGVIEPGRLADAAILSNDPLTCDTPALKDIVAEATIVGGQIVYRRDGGRGIAAG
jgi:predicted amidohydrolase YtcJ